MSTAPRPSFFIVGAPKCATTSMCDYLNQHPQLFVPAIKELHYFAQDYPGNREADTLDDYLAYFADAGERVCGEGSVWYLHSTTAAREIKDFDPDARIIVMLRDPVAYIVSRHAQSQLTLQEDLPDLEAALAAEPARRDGGPVAPRCHNRWALLYTETARFGAQLQRYLDVFGQDRVHVILMDDLRTDTLGACRAVFRFLEVDEGFEPDPRISNPRRRVRSRHFHHIITDETTRARVARITPKRLRTPIGRMLMRLNTGRAPSATIGSDLERRLRELLRNDVEHLGRLIDRDLSGWVGR